MRRPLLWLASSAEHGRRSGGYQSVTELFEIEWLGGVAEHHFRKARPAGDLEWSLLDARAYPASLVAAAREVWTGVATSEYAAIAAFSQVVGALAAARAPLDLIGMTSDFLADEVLHVELASRLLMQLGGAAPKHFDPARLGLRLQGELTPFQRANELALRVGCISEVFASATAGPIMLETTHPLVRAVYERIIRDEARHRRFGALYFEWAQAELDDQERERLAQVTLSAVEMFAPIWRRAARLPEPPVEWRGFDVHELGWMEPTRYVPLARNAMRDEVLPPLRALGLPLPEADLEALIES
jgi:P-aminobenzoate N-oxygenase AurF